MEPSHQSKTKKPIIFLDFDGVLNHDLFYKVRHEASPRGVRLAEFDRETIARLNNFLKKVNGEVVVTSTYRKHLNEEGLRDLLHFYGFTGTIIGTTPIFGEHCVRGNEILAWTKDNADLVGPYHEFRNYVIFDDDSDMLYWHRNNFIHVDPYCGLTPRDCFLAGKILQSATNPIEWTV